MQKIKPATVIQNIAQKEERKEEEKEKEEEKKKRRIFYKDILVMN